MAQVWLSIYAGQYAQLAITVKFIPLRSYESGELADLIASNAVASTVAENSSYLYGVPDKISISAPHYERTSNCSICRPQRFSCRRFAVTGYSTAA